MPESPGFTLTEINDRAMVRLRVRPHGADSACQALQLPQQALRWHGEDPTAHWLGPDQWLLTSNTKSASDIVSHIDTGLSGHLYAAIEVSASNACFALTGPTARRALAMGCGIDLHPDAFKTSHCTRTHFANVQLFIVAVEENSFNLYVDRSLTSFLRDWFANAGEDPLTHLQRTVN